MPKKKSVLKRLPELVEPQIAAVAGPFEAELEGLSKYTMDLLAEAEQKRVEAQQIQWRRFSGLADDAQAYLNAERFIADVAKLQPHLARSRKGLQDKLYGYQNIRRLWTDIEKLVGQAQNCCDWIDQQAASTSPAPVGSQSTQLRGLVAQLNTKIDTYSDALDGYAFLNDEVFSALGELRELVDHMSSKTVATTSEVAARKFNAGLVA